MKRNWIFQSKQQLRGSSKGDFIDRRILLCVFKAIFKLLKSHFWTLEIGLWGEHIFSESDFLKYHVQKDKNSK